MRVDADPADPAELEEGLDQVVVAGVEVEARLDDVPRLREVVVRLLDRAHRRDLGELRDRLGLDVDHDARRDVVDDDRLVARRARSPRSARRCRAAAACCSTASRRGTRRRRARAPARSGAPSAPSSTCRFRRRPLRRFRPPRSQRGRDRCARRRSASGSRPSSRRRRCRRSRSRRGAARAAGTSRSRPTRPRGTASRSRSGRCRASARFYVWTGETPSAQFSPSSNCLRHSPCLLG